MYRSTPVLSIIMPCFNIADTLPRALDSILMQQVDFAYEILIVNDCSTDNTVDIAVSYAEKHKQLSLIQHQENQGNAGSFYSGLCAAKGDFFCVLDGDDYYTHREKLQRQIDFFRSDVLHEYVASAHHYILDLCDGSIKIDKRTNVTDFTYVDFLTQNAGYYHTSTYMFRNIFKGNVPELFKEDRFRGDSPRTTFHLQMSRKKIKILDFAGSAYFYNYSGIWSGISEGKQKERQLLYLESLRSMITTKYELSCVDNLINHTKKNWDTSNSRRSFLAADIEYYLEQLKRYTGMLAFEQSDFTFQGLYYSQYIDSLCATLGYVNQVYNPECMQQVANANRLAIVIGLLNPQGGGIFREIIELIKIYEDHEILILLTNITDEKVSSQAHDIICEYPNVSIKATPSSQSEKLVWLSRTMADFAPYKAYYYTSHNDPYAQALMQSGVCKNVCLFSFDHGYICGISNPNLDCIIAKRPMDYEMLHKSLGEKVIYIPTWGTDPIDCDGLQYKPFNGHSNLITASGAARFYKLDDTPLSSYTNNILELLLSTKGQHFHFGPIPQEKLEFIQTYLREHDLPQESFVHIEWSDNMVRDMLTNHVDIFLEPFPVVSYKMTLEVLSAGIPIIAQKNIRRIGKLDFIYPDSLFWKYKSDFVDTLSNLTADQLEEHSRRSLEYFQSTHSINVIRPYLLHEKPFPLLQKEESIDDVLTEIRPYERMFGQNGTLNLLYEKEQKKTTRQAVALKPPSPQADSGAITPSKPIAPMQQEPEIKVAPSLKRKIKDYTIRYITKKNVSVLCLFSLLFSTVGLRFLSTDFFGISEIIGGFFVFLGLLSFILTGFLIFTKLAVKVYIYLKWRKT